MQFSLNIWSPWPKDQESLRSEEVRDLIVIGGSMWWMRRTNEEAGLHSSTRCSGLTMRKDFSSIEWIFTECVLHFELWPVL